MTFDELLDHAIALLQRRGRLTYRALKRQFDLDDSCLDDLKEELIKGQRLAVDEHGDVLVWTGGAALGAAPVFAPASPQGQVPLAYTPPAPRRKNPHHAQAPSKANASKSRSSSAT